MTADSFPCDAAPRLERTLTRASWQPLLFGTPNRADLALCTADWPLRRIKVRVHRNHGFEPVATAMPPYAAWNGLRYEFALGGYDDSLSFDLRDDADADADLVWLDTQPLTLSGTELTSWLLLRLRALRAQSTHPILLLAWPADSTMLAALRRSEIADLHAPNLNPLARRAGPAWLDRRAQSLSGTRLSNRACLVLARELACRWLPASLCPPVKAIALDMDGTLYEGALAEEGAAGVGLTEGHRALQARLATLRTEGRLLALVSRNERADVDELFERRLDFPLRPHDFSAAEISWDSKADALDRIASQLRIGADAIVFIDDNPGELLAAASRTGVFTVHARDDARETLEALDHVAGLFRWAGSSEDALRAHDLATSAERAALGSAAASDDEYLRSLQVRLEYSIGAKRHQARVAELFQKTNQFNLSLGRMSEAGIARRVDENPSNVVAIRLRDRLSDSGIVGALAGRRHGDTLHLEEVCISCRALGRRIEDAMLVRAIQLMGEGETEPTVVSFDVAHGPRNAPALEWLARHAPAPIPSGIAAVEIPFAALASQPLAAAIRLEVRR